MNTDVMFSSATDQWATPQAFFDEWHAMFNDWNARGVNSKFQVMPKNSSCNVYLPQQIHTGGINALMMDGSVRNVGSGVNVINWAASLTPNGGEVQSLDN